MAIFTRSRPLPATPNPQVNLASPWVSSELAAAVLNGLWPSSDLLPATRIEAMRIPAVKRGRALIAVSVARMPLVAVDKTGAIASQPQIVRQPEIGRARFTSLLWTVDDLLFGGVSWWLVTHRYAEDGRPRYVVRVPPVSAGVDAASGRLVKAFGETVAPRDAIRFDGPDEGLLSAAATHIRTTARLQAAYARHADNPVPAVELHQTQGNQLGDKEIQELTSAWVEARRGKNGGVAYTNQSVEARVHGVPAENLLISGRQEARLDTAHAMLLPGWAVDAQPSGSSLTYSNTPSRSRELIDYTLSGYMEAITSRLSLDDILPAGVWATFDSDVLTDGDFGTRMSAYQTAEAAGIYTNEELRQRERGMPIEGPTP